MKSPHLRTHAARHRVWLGSLAITLSSVLTSASPWPVSAAEATPTVHIENFTFAPATLTVKAGTRVTWTNRDDEPHTVTSSSTPRTFASGALDTDATFAFTFDKPGTYPYFCAVHPHMTGVIVVK
ncbi:putative Amicyanin precursor [Pandoraea captiosa]|uniref:Putative Amicyanin n=1 Tax=Pandoraea captiosa TaxID=2508302 RepID=A0A5E4ZLI4_9BURK|nr:cupredoxin family copper-binding protein [Pandoraea captiosa]VVE61708.1 putative Amicyanin precursor [Pandoraea captiosa]